MSSSETSSIDADDRRLLAKMRGRFGLFAQNKEIDETLVQEGPAVDQPQPRQSETLRRRQELPSRTPSPSPSNAKSIGRLLTRMKLFREVIKDEVTSLLHSLSQCNSNTSQMAHTAFVALSNVVSMVASLIGVFAHLPTSPTFFIGAYCAYSRNQLWRIRFNVVDRGYPVSTRNQ